METKRFARSKNSFLSGVCAGLAEYTGINVTLMRVLWVLMALISWIGFMAVIAYIVLFFVMQPPEGTPENERYSVRNSVNGRNLTMACAIVLICWGAYILLEAFLQINLGRYLFPAGLILGGVVLMTFAFGRKKQS